MLNLLDVLEKVKLKDVEKRILDVLLIEGILTRKGLEMTLNIPERSLRRYTNHLFAIGLVKAYRKGDVVKTFELNPVLIEIFRFIGHGGHDFGLMRRTISNYLLRSSGCNGQGLCNTPQTMLFRKQVRGEESQFRETK